MELQRLGSTQLEISRIGVGTWQYKAGTEPLRAAIDHGVRLIDTAESYGNEGIVAEAVRGRRREVAIATKALPRNFRRKSLIAAAEASLRRLQVDYIDLYQLHWLNYAVPIEETMSAMEELADAGKIRFIGVSNFYLSDLKRAQRALSKHKIVSNQLRYSLIDRSIERNLLSFCKEQGITILAFSPLASGPATIYARDRAHVLEQLSHKHARTKAQIALNWILRNENVLVLTRASTPSHVLENCGASGWRLAPEEYRRLGDSVQHHSRGATEVAARSYARRVLQMFGRSM